MPLIITCTDHLSTKPKTELLSCLPGPTSLIALWIAWVRGFTSNKCLNDFHWIPLWGFKSVIVLFKNGCADIRENNLGHLNLPGLLFIRFSFTVCGQVNFLIKVLKFLPGMTGRPWECLFPVSSRWWVFFRFWSLEPYQIPRFQFFPQCTLWLQVPPKVWNVPYFCLNTGV